MITGKNIQFRTVDIADAEFIFALRTQRDKTKYLSQIENDLVKQKAWLNSYKLKEKTVKNIISSSNPRLEKCLV